MPIRPEMPGSVAALACGCTVSGTSVVTPMAAGDFCGKRGVVSKFGCAPDNGGAEGLGGRDPEGGFETLGIGLVIAVDQAGGAEEAGVGTKWPVALMGNVVAAEIFGRGVGLIF